MIQKLTLSLLLFISLTGTALAVPPPDFIINVGSQAVGVFSFIAALLAAVFTISFQFLKTIFYAHKKKTIILAAILILGLSWLGTHIYKDKKTKQAEASWQIQQLEVKSQKAEVKAEKAEVKSQKAEGISNLAFKSIATPFVLDAREDIEFEYGNFEGSTHIRFADLKAGEWKRLPSDEEIYVICWSGIRGKKVADFLAEQGLKAKYLEEGANGWVKSGGTWNGEIAFSSIYPDADYGQTFSTTTVKSKIENENVLLVDARRVEEINDNIASYNIDLQDTPSSELTSLFEAIPEASRIITVCDEYTNCFIAKLLGVELERRGHKFLGRYNQPWTWQK